MSKRILGLLTLGLLTGPLAANAIPVSFYATGNAEVSGFVQFESSAFDGDDFQFLSNTFVTDLSITAFGSTFGLGDVVSGDNTIMDSSGATPRIVNGAGLLADNGAASIAFYPDGFGGTALDGDASLAFGPGGGFGEFRYYQVLWSTSAPDPVPEPGSLALLGLGLAGMGLSRRRKAA